MVRTFAWVLAIASLVVAVLAPPARGGEPLPPILFVHGNGDSAALWITTVWRFESSGYDPARLFALDFAHPRARTDDTKPQDNRSSTEDALRELAAKVAEILSRTGQKQVVHVYRTPFPRSNPYVHLRLRPLGDKDRGAGALVTLTRPRGYLGHGRDTFLLDGKVPAGVNDGVPGTSEATQRFEPGPPRTVRAVLNAEAMTVRTYPLEHGHVTIAEFHC